MPQNDQGPPELAVRQLYQHCRVTLRPALAGRLGSTSEADDVLHEAFVRFLSRYAVDAVSNPLAMLARIAMNIVRDAARASTFRRDALVAHGAAPIAAQSPADPEIQAARRQDLRRLRDSIDALPRRCREVFLLRRIEGLSQDEVAALLNISRSAVEKHMIRARALLRRDMEATAIDRIGESRA